MNIKEYSLDDKTKRYYNYCYNRFSKTTSFNKDILLKDISKKNINELIVTLKQNNPSIRNTSINTYLRGLRAILYYFIEQGYTSNFKVNLLPETVKIKQSYSKEDLIRLLEKPTIKKCTFTQYRNWVLVQYFLATGNRLKSIVNIKIR